MNPVQITRSHGGPDSRGAVRWDFSTNVNAAGPCPQAVQALARADATRYPDPCYEALCLRLAALHGVAPQRILLAASASEFIQRVTAVASRLESGPVAVPARAYGDYAVAAQACGRSLTGPDAAGVALRWFAEPGSPCGQDAPPPADVAYWPSVLDAAYEPLRLTGHSSWTQEALDAVFQLYSPNKALGLPGVRGAYAIAPTNTRWPVQVWCDALAAAQPSWPLSAHAVALLEAWTQEATQSWLATSRATLRQWTAALRAGLQSLGLEPMHSVTPFLCARRPAAADPALLRARGLAVRDAASFGLPGWMRLAAQPPEALDALLAALGVQESGPGTMHRSAGRRSFPAMNPNRFSDADIAAVYRTIHSRRDIREFVPGPLAAGVLERLLLAAHAAPSVGYMQPWRLIHITDPVLRTSICGIVEAERQRTAAALPTRNEEFLKLKVEGLKHCAEVVVVALMDGREQHIFGRRTLPEMDLASAACAIQNMWLAARAEGVGLGWVSIFEPAALSALLSMPAGAKPIAILCIGQVLSFPQRPLLDVLGWGQRLALERVVFENHWPADAKPTPPAY